MIDLEEHLAEVFAQESAWDDALLYVAVREQRRRKNLQVLAWCKRHSKTPSRLKSVRAAQSRYSKKHPDRVSKSQKKYATKKWSKIRSDQDKLDARRKYQREWLAKKRSTRQAQTRASSDAPRKSRQKLGGR